MSFCVHLLHIYIFIFFKIDCHLFSSSNYYIEELCHNLSTVLYLLYMHELLNIQHNVFYRLGNNFDYYNS